MLDLLTQSHFLCLLNRENNHCSNYIYEHCALFVKTNKIIKVNLKCYSETNTARALELKMYTWY